MTTNNNMTTTTAAAIENTAAAAEKAAPAVWPVRYERMTFGEYLDAIAAGEIAEPVFQRGAVWTEKQNARLLACLLAGRVMPAIIVATVPMTDGERLGLLVDGKQRTTALTTALEAAETDGDDERAEAIKAIAVDILYTDTPSLTAAAEFFVDLNSGAKLSAIQRNKAALSDSCMAFVNSFQNELTRARPGEKWGKVNADTAAAMLAAAVVDGVNVATSSAGASKILAGVKDAPAFPALRLAQLLRAIQLLEAGDAQTVADYNAAKAAALGQKVQNRVIGFVPRMWRERLESPLFNNKGPELGMANLYEALRLDRGGLFLPAAREADRAANGVDAVAGATMTSDAVFTAMDDCLSQAE